MSEVSIESTLAAVRSLMDGAERSLIALDRHDAGGGDDWMHSNSIVSDMEIAFTQLMLMAEAMGLTETYVQIRKAYDEAKGRENGLSAYANDPDGDLHLFAASALRQFVRSFEAVYGLKSLHVVSKSVVDVLRATQYAITDPNCFAEPPGSESDVHHRIEAVLRCVFPNLDHQPPVPKAIKNFEPDTGLPTVRSLVEYKFVQTKGDVKRVADEILADTRGYKSGEWDKFIFVIYETRRLVSEKEWNRLLQQCGTAINTQAIVICGEVPNVKPKQGKSSPTPQKTKP